MKKEMNRKGISPVVATILLIALVILISLIVFLWFRGIRPEYGEKFGKNVELVCEDVQLDATYSGDTLYVINDGTVPVYRINIKLSGAGSYTTEDLIDLTDWPKNGLAQGGVFSDYLDVGTAEEITLIPVLLGTSDKGNKQSFACDERYGYELSAY